MRGGIIEGLGGFGELLKWYLAHSKHYTGLMMVIVHVADRTAWKALPSWSWEGSCLPPSELPHQILFPQSLALLPRMAATSIHADAFMAEDLASLHISKENNNTAR